jgi:hypothetical protein
MPQLAEPLSKGCHHQGILGGEGGAIVCGLWTLPLGDKRELGGGGGKVGDGPAKKQLLMFNKGSDQSEGIRLQCRVMS